MHSSWIIILTDAFVVAVNLQVAYSYAFVDRSQYV